MGGTAQFGNGFLHQQDFPVTCLYFTGFFLVVVSYRLISLKRDKKKIDFNTLKLGFLGNIYDFNQKCVRKQYTAQVIFRASLLLTIYWCAISSIHYANLAKINFGIVSCCFIVSVVVNSAAGLAFFNEKITLKTCSGIIVTMCGIIWISLAKGGEALAQKDAMTSVDQDIVEEALLNKSKAVILALGVGVGNALQTIQSKFMMRNPATKFGVMSITSDIGLFFAIIALTLTFVFYISGVESINLYNFTLTLFTSILAMLCWLVG